MMEATKVAYLTKNWVNILYKYMQHDEPWLEISVRLPKLLDIVLSRIHVKQKPCLIGSSCIFFPQISAACRPFYPRVECFRILVISNIPMRHYDVSIFKTYVMTTTKCKPET